MADPVSVTFIHQRDQRVEQKDIYVPSGLHGFDQRLTVACMDLAYDYDFSCWVQPYTNLQAAREVTEWLVFRLLPGRRVFVTRQPTREAAEMWVIHRGE